MRDAIVAVLRELPDGAPVSEIESRVYERIGEGPASSIRSYLRINTPKLFARAGRGHYVLRENVPARYDAGRGSSSVRAPFRFERTVLYYADCLDWLREQEQKANVHAYGFMAGHPLMRSLRMRQPNATSEIVELAQYQ